MAAMLIVATVIITAYFSLSLMDNIKTEMHQQANYIKTTYPNPQDYNRNVDNTLLKELSNYQILISDEKTYNHEGYKITSYEEDEHEYLQLTTQYNDKYPNYLIINRDITHEDHLISKMYYISFFIMIIAVLFSFYYARLLSEKLMKPLKDFTSKFTHMNEGLLEPVKIKNLPIEFIKLSESINLLITKIQTFLNYRKELFIGTAHELKTPLAVMRLKNQILLMKYKKQDNIQETLKQNIESIDNLNAMIHNILEYGRAEGAQFEKPERINLIRLMASKCEEYELLAHSQNRDFIYHFNIPHLRISIQTLLFMQIFQNFIQNALRFSPEGGLVTLDTRMDANNFIIEIKDEGPGIDTAKDLFAPFQRSVESTGAGLGLFLAQNAAESMGVHIKLENRTDRRGAIASIHLPFSNFLLRHF